MRLMKSDTIPTATQLQEAGVKIRAAPKGTTTLLNVKFENGILEIPELIVNSRMKLRFQNVIAFERCYYSSSYCLNYLRLLDHLIDTPSDVLLLKDKGIIINLFGDDEEVADMFNNIGSTVISTVDSQYTDLYEELNQYYANPWRKWKAMLKRDYFNSPWSSIAFAAAAMILIWTLIQTICTVMQTDIGQQILERKITIEDDRAIASLEAKLLQGQHHFISCKSCIFKVLATIRELDEKAFIPKAVSIGPYHRKKLEQYEAMEKCKVHYLKQFLCHKPSITLKDCVEMLKELEEEARRCYSDDMQPYE
ncbi:hypothetical protein Sjap_019201 [Stephania japonica]|uniref:Uncharacterized protein n=1 Tax=Stephania japonica TaxID=461633 RepID=A0AAP0F153_9MAGN